jgi:hypothetical protein
VTMHIKSGSVPAFRLELLGTLSWTPYLLSDRLTAHWFSGNCSTRTVWTCASSCEVQDVVSLQRSISTLWWRCLAMAKHGISRKVERTLRTHLHGLLCWHV